MPAPLLRLALPVGAVVALVAALVLGGGVFDGAAAADVHGDDERDAYVGTGGLILPGTVDDRTRQEVATCAGCHWRMATPCIESGAGRPFDGQSPCLSVVRGCPAGRQLLRTWFRPADGRWREVGLVCVGGAGPVTVADVGRRARETVVRGIPVLSPTFQPHRGVVTQLPVVFDSGQPAGSQRWDLVLAGASVHLVATPSWSWEFGDDATFGTVDPGGRYPHTAVAHVYRRAGSQRVTVTTRWRADFSVDGLGPFAVPEPVAQEEVIVVPVGEGRAVLTPA